MNCRSHFHKGKVLCLPTARMVAMVLRGTTILLRAQLEGVPFALSFCNCLLMFLEGPEAMRSRKNLLHSCPVHGY